MTHQFKVGEPVWACYIEKESLFMGRGPEKGTFVRYFADEIGSKVCLVRLQNGSVRDFSPSRVSPRPTLMWTVRQWVRSLVGKK